MITFVYACIDLELQQMDMKANFHKGESNEKINMEQPIGFIVRGQEQIVCNFSNDPYDGSRILQHPWSLALIRKQKDNKSTRRAT